MKFTVKEKTVSSVTIEYEDGSIATIPIIKGNNKETIQSHAAHYNTVATQFDSVDDVPVSVGEVLDTIIAGEMVPDKEAGYEEARKYHYPSNNKQLDAAYWARNGDDTQQKSIDAAIKLVKDTIPKTWRGNKNDIAKLMD